MVKLILALATLISTVCPAYAGLFSAETERPPMSMSERPINWLGAPTDGLLRANVLGQAKWRGDTRPASQLLKVHPVDANPVLDGEIGGLSIRNATLAEAVGAALDPLGIAWVIASAPGGSTGGAEPLATVANVVGSPDKALDAVSEAFGMHWKYVDNRVVISRTQNYELLLPPGRAVAEAIVPTVFALGATNVVYDAALGAVIFTASQDVAKRVEGHVAKMIAEQKQIVFEVFAFQVDLSDDAQLGIAWDTLKWNDGTTAVNLGKQAALGSGVISQISFSSAKLSVDLLLSFLKTQGDVKVLSKPVLQVLSGGTAKLRNGADTTYLKNMTQTRDAQGGAVTSVEQAVAKSGFELELTGKVRNGTVYTDIKLALDDLISLNLTQVGESTQLTLPQTAKRELQSSLRALDGEAAILGGVVSERTEVNRSKFLFFNLSETKRVIRSELVFYIKPTVVTFGAEPQPETTSF